MLEAGDAVGEPAGEDRVAAEAVLVGERLLDAEAEPLVDAAAVVHHRAPRERRRSARRGPPRLECRARGDDAVDEADALGLGRVELAAGEDEVERAAEADDARQPVGAAVDERHAPPPLEAAEARGLARNAEVAPRRELDATGDAPPLDRRDHRLRQREPGRPERTGRPQLGEIPQVRARAERLLVAREHRDLRVGVGVERDELVVQPGRGRAC